MTPLPARTDRSPAGVSRRHFVAACSALGVTSAVFSDTLWASTRGGSISSRDLDKAARLAGLEFTRDERKLMIEGINDLVGSYAKIRQVPIPNHVLPAFRFDPTLPDMDLPGTYKRFRMSQPRPARPADDGDLAFMSVLELSWLLREREVTSVELTQLYLDRLKAFDPQLECVITLTEERALERAEAADAEIGAGRRLGPLHGVPYGAKDLLAVAGYPTTWGATPFRDQEIDLDATAVRRLDSAGAVLVAKLTLGALAWGDVWYGGTTRSPWNTAEGSSGSSAGSAAATAAGLVGFSLGSETWGSIVSPCTQCGATGLRPTFGRVSRHGAMALSWTMDKLGPICRTVEDCAIVFQALLGPDDRDPTVVDHPFNWNAEKEGRGIRVGYVPSLFEAEPEDAEEAAQRELDLATLETLRGLDVKLEPIELPDLPVEALSFILTAEAAAAFDDLTRSGRDDMLVRQIQNAWPNVLREARTIPAVEYIQANRVRTLLAVEMERVLKRVEVYVAPSFGGHNLLLTNLTGHPAVVVPNGIKPNGMPGSITFCGRLFGEAETLSVAKLYQDATDFHLRRPPLTPA